jgi:hypothetical protein
MSTYAAHTHTRRGIGAAIWSLVFGLIVGAGYVILSLPDGMTRLSAREGWTWLAKPAHWSSTINDGLPGFADMQRLILYALLAYGGALLILSLRHGQPGLIGMGLITLTAATCVLHVIAWIGFIGFYVGYFIVWILGVVFGFLANIIRNVALFLYEHVFSLLQPLFVGQLSWVGIGAVVLLLVLLTYKFGTGFLKGLALWVAGVAALMAFAFLFAWIFKFVAPVIVYIIAGGLALVALVTIGQLFVDQIKSTMLAGSGRRGVVMGAIAIGSTFALLLLMGNVYGLYSLYPPAFTHFADQWIKSKSTPGFDAIVAFCITALCALGVVRSLVRMRPEPSLAEFGRSMIYTVLGMIFGGTLAAVSHQTES